MNAELVDVDHRNAERSPGEAVGEPPRGGHFNGRAPIGCVDACPRYGRTVNPQAFAPSLGSHLRMHVGTMRASLAAVNELVS